MLQSRHQKTRKLLSSRLNFILKRLSIGVSTLVLFCLLGAYIVSGEIYDYQDTVDGTHLPEVDAIVCLAGGRGRIAAAGDLWYRYWELTHYTGESIDGHLAAKASTDFHSALGGAKPPRSQVPILYFSGMGRQSNWVSVSKLFRTGVVKVIQPREVIIENESSNTDTNAQWLAQYARERHWRKILLLTSSYHMKRARFMFERVLTLQDTPVKVETLSVYQEPFAPDEWRFDLNGIRVTLIEYLKWVYYRSFW